MKDDSKPIATLVVYGDAVDFRRYLAGEIDLATYAKLEGTRVETQFHVDASMTGRRER